MAVKRSHASCQQCLRARLKADFTLPQAGAEAAPQRPHADISGHLQDDGLCTGPSAFATNPYQVSVTYRNGFDFKDPQDRPHRAKAVRLHGR